MTKVYLTSGTSWTVPTDWSNTGYLIEAIGAGGNGAPGTSNTYSGGGGGAGAYCSLDSSLATYSPGNTVTFQIGVGGGTTGAFTSPTSNTWLNNSNNTATAVLAPGGTSTTTNIRGVPPSLSNCIGVTKRVGGNGGLGVSGTIGGGAGGAGANGNSTSSGTGGSGTSSASGAGSAGGGTAAAAGGAGATSSVAAVAGTNGTDYQTSPAYGAGGGGGGGSTTVGFLNGAAGGNYGSGGGGGGLNGTSVGTGGAGKGGLIVVTYTPSINAALTVTEAKDTTASTATVTSFASLGATDATDTSNISVAIIVPITLASTEAPDTASATINYSLISLSSVEPTDISDLNVKNPNTDMSFAITEAADTFGIESGLTKNITNEDDNGFSYGGSALSLSATQTTTSTTTLSATGSATVNVGDLIFIVYSIRATTATVTFSDNLSGTYTALTGGAAGITGLVRAAYRVATAAGTLSTVTATLSAASSVDKAMFVSVFPGPYLPTAALDKNPATLSDTAAPYASNLSGTLVQLPQTLIGYQAYFGVETAYSSVGNFIILGPVRSTGASPAAAVLSYWNDNTSVASTTSQFNSTPTTLTTANGIATFKKVNVLTTARFEPLDTAAANVVTETYASLASVENVDTTSIAAKISDFPYFALTENSDTTALVTTVVNRVTMPGLENKDVASALLYPLPYYASAGAYAYSTSTTGLSPVIPTSAVGDLLIAVLILDKTYPVSNMAINGGWTQLTGGGQSGGRFSEYVFYKIYQAGDPAPTITWTGLSWAEARILRFVGVNTATPIGGVSAINASSATTTYTANSIMTASNNSLVVTLVGKDDTFIAATPSGWTLVNNATGAGSVSCAFVKLYPALGTVTGNVSASAGSAYWTANQIEIISIGVVNTNLPLAVTEAKDTMSSTLTSAWTIPLTVTEGTDGLTANVTLINRVNVGIAEFGDFTFIGLNGALADPRYISIGVSENADSISCNATAIYLSSNFFFTFR